MRSQEEIDYIEEQEISENIDKRIEEIEFDELDISVLIEVIKYDEFDTLPIDIKDRFKIINLKALKYYYENNF